MLPTGFHIFHFVSFFYVFFLFFLFLLFRFFSHYFVFVFLRFVFFSFLFVTFLLVFFSFFFFPFLFVSFRFFSVSQFTGTRRELATQNISPCYLAVLLIIVFSPRNNDILCIFVLSWRNRKHASFYLFVL